MAYFIANGFFQHRFDTSPGLVDVQRRPSRARLADGCREPTETSRAGGWTWAGEQVAACLNIESMRKESIAPFLSGDV